MPRLFPALCLALLPAAAQADLTREYFSGGSGCYVREYSVGHLASHPDQLVTHIALRPSDLGVEPPLRGLDVFVRLRGSDEVFQGTGYCETGRNRWDCGMEGDAGSFTLTGEKPGTLRLTVGRYGMSFEGQADFVTLSATEGDDRVFLIPVAPAADCD